MKISEIEKLTQVIKELRDPQKGCPWDLEQTHQSLNPYLIEESYEFIEACENSRDDDMEDELGDILLQILLHAQIASERGSFNFESICQNLREKIVRRHPHVFGDNQQVISTSEVIENWDKIKQTEEAKSETHIKSSLANAPSLYSAYKIGNKTKKINFDWDDPIQVMYKVEEEWQELKEELGPLQSSTGKINPDRVNEELGDFLFSMAQLARHLGVNPEESLRQANQKFISRFQKMEKLIKEDRNEGLDGLNQSEMDFYWNRVKKEEL